ncbi:MAG: UDP-N-acetylmuramate dehydrogenase [Lachnospiraceae bacterium]|nr:UDP-N-acetylmuramate dehydrogenase [Lachnospiraceae bacterium]
MYENLKKEVEEIIKEDQILCAESLAKHTTFRIGGPADLFLQPQNEKEITKLVRFCREKEVPFYIMGNGSNILASDKGYTGIILHIGKNMSSVKFTEKDKDTVLVTAEAGIMLIKLAREAANQSLTGLEFAGGIPGTLGGAITMNAGAYGGEIKDCIVWAKVVTKEGNVMVLNREELALGYRSSIIQKEGWIVTEAQFALTRGNKTEIVKTMDELQKKRKEKQPLEYSSAGSTFKSPEGFFAGKLIEDAGLRGYRVGDIMVSDKHCGFVVNVGKGTAEEVHMLMEHVEQTVYEKFGVTLEPEVRFLGG